MTNESLYGARLKELHAVVHIKLNGVGGHVEFFNFFHLQGNVSIDDVVIHYA